MISAADRFMLRSSTMTRLIQSDHGLISLFEHDLFGKPAPTFPDHALVLLHHKFCCDVFLPIEVAQHGHRDKDLTSATSNRRRVVATEFGMWRSGRNGG